MVARTTRIDHWQRPGRKAVAKLKAKKYRGHKKRVG